jgi:NAD(P)-dependent dehydrogenase (short-subunit alcohol dehydrogenase family)
MLIPPRSSEWGGISPQIREDLMTVTIGIQALAHRDLMALIVGISAFGLGGLASAQTVLITGANSGLGLEFARQYAAKGWTVIATHRRDEVPATLAELLSTHDNVRVETLDVANEAQVFGVAEKLRGQAIDVLINNAGIFCFCDWMDDSYNGQRFGTLSWKDFGAIMEVNVRGMAMVTQAFFEHVKASDQKKVITMTSTIGRVSDPRIAQSALWYGASKAAVNKVSVTIAQAVRNDNVIVVPMHPGAVRVEKQADDPNPDLIEPEYSISRMIETIDGLTMAESGHFILFDGSELPW